MRKLLEKKPILHAVAWILLYILVVNMGDGLSAQTGVSNSMTSLLLVGFSAVLLLYLKNNGWFKRYGIRRITSNDLTKALFYAPLVLLALIQFVGGIDTSLSAQEISTFCLLMVSVGFIEEIIFRGFLFEGIRSQSGLNRAILISGITFGIGHIVNLLRGYAYAELMGQIIVATVIGIVLALLAAITKNLVPGILFHIVFNISGSITNVGSSVETYVMLAILGISVVYAVYLSKFLQRTTQANGLANTITSKA